MKQLLLPLTAALLAAAVPAMASQPPAANAPAPEEVRIPMVRFGGIRDFRSEGEQIVYLRGINRQWYKATLNGPCFNLPQALRIGLDTRFNGDTLDRTSTLIVEGQRCPIMSLVRSDPPPPRRRARR